MLFYVELIGFRDEGERYEKGSVLCCRKNETRIV